MLTCLSGFEREKLSQLVWRSLTIRRIIVWFQTCSLTWLLCFGATKNFHVRHRIFKICTLIAPLSKLQKTFERFQNLKLKKLTFLMRNRTKGCSDLSCLAMPCPTFPRLSLLCPPRPAPCHAVPCRADVM